MTKDVKNKVDDDSWRLLTGAVCRRLAVLPRWEAAWINGSPVAPPSFWLYCQCRAEDELTCGNCSGGDGEKKTSVVLFPARCDPGFTLKAAAVLAVDSKPSAFARRLDSFTWGLQDRATTKVVSRIFKENNSESELFCPSELCLKYGCVQKREMIMKQTAGIRQNAGIKSIPAFCSSQLQI